MFAFGGTRRPFLVHSGRSQVGVRRGREQAQLLQSGADGTRFAVEAVGYSPKFNRPMQGERGSDPAFDPGLKFLAGDEVEGSEVLPGEPAEKEAVVEADSDTVDVG